MKTDVWRVKPFVPAGIGLLQLYGHPLGVGVVALPAGDARALSPPYPLALFEPVIDSWNLRGFSGPGEERRLVAKDTLEWSKPSGALAQGILGILHPAEVAAPTVLVLVEA